MLSWYALRVHLNWIYDSIEFIISGIKVSIKFHLILIHSLLFGYAVYGVNPTFIISTATVANPREHAMV